MQLFIFTPAGDFADRSLPCIPEAPAAPLLHGADIGTADEAAALLPFTRAGMITVIYSIDGALPESLPRDGSSAHARGLQTAYKQFTEAEEGVRNGARRSTMCSPACGRSTRSSSSPADTVPRRHWLCCSPPRTSGCRCASRAFPAPTSRRGTDRCSESRPW